MNISVRKDSHNDINSSPQMANLLKSPELRRILQIYNRKLLLEKEEKYGHKFFLEPSECN
jgi:hypothetical protein